MDNTVYGPAVCAKGIPSLYLQSFEGNKIVR